jgi:hypothetical protein
VPLILLCFVLCTGASSTELLGMTGILTSSNYPQDYNDNERKTYLLVAPTGSTIVLVFQDFDIEPEYTCFFDYLQVYLSVND